MRTSDIYAILAARRDSAITEEEASDLLAAMSTVTALRMRSDELQDALRPRIRLHQPFRQLVAG